MKHKIQQDIELFLAPQMEGKLYLWINLWVGSGNLERDFVIQKIHYTVKSGVVYEISGTKLIPSGDTLFEVQKDCRLVGDYEVGKVYDIISKTLKWDDIERLFNTH